MIETEDDRRLAEARVKAVTGQDLITCRFLYGEFFSYLPQFKIWMAMNHKPIIRGTDHAIWRRIRLIPFTQSFTGRADLALGEKLLAELPGILNWALEGLRAWQREGLGTAKAIDEATNAYRRESDLVSQWLLECVSVDRGGVMSAKAAYESYRDWCKDRGERESTSRALGRRLSELGFKSDAYGQTRTMHHFGLRLGVPETPEESYESYEAVLGKTLLVTSSRVKVPENSTHNSHNSHNSPTVKQNGHVPAKESQVVIDREIEGRLDAFLDAGNWQAAKHIVDGIQGRKDWDRCMDKIHACKDSLAVAP